jgi:L-fuculose-phosphate aldolase
MIDNVTTQEETRLRKLICKVGRLMRRYGYIDGGSGNISARLGPDRILITPSGPGKGFLKPDQLIVIDMDGNKVGPATEANRNLHASSETPMHLEAYRLREDVNGVVHAHPPNATPDSIEDRDAIREVIQHHDVVMLSHHGSLTVAPDLWTAYLRLETLEHYARILFKASLLGTPQPLLPDQVSKLLALRERLGLMRAQDETLFKKYFGATLDND